MQRLIDYGFPFGAITVLSRPTVPYIRETFAFFDKLGIGFRALPYCLSASSDQLDAHALTHDEIANAFEVLFDLWLESESGVRISPLDEYMAYAIRHLNGAEKRVKNLKDDEIVFVVDLDGNVYGESHDYDPDLIYGNIFEQSLETILNSETRRRLCAEADERMDAHCRDCPYFGACPGGYVMTASAEQRKLLASNGCPVREMISYILDRFEETDLAGTVQSTVAGNKEDEPVATAIGRA